MTAVAQLVLAALLALARPASPDAGDDDEPDVPANVPAPLYCPGAPDVAPPGVAIVLRCVAQPGLDVARVLLFFRAPGAEDFTTRPTTRSPAGWFKAVVPAAAVVGSQVQYFLEARNPADDVVATAGRRDSPNLVLLKSGAAPAAEGLEAMRAREQELAAPEAEDPLEHARRASASHAQAQPRRVWLSAGIGLGYGWAGKRTLEWAKELVAPAGGYPAGPWFVEPEIGFRVRPSFALALALRSELIASEGHEPGRDGAPARGASSLLVRAMYLAGTERVRFSLGGLAGGGEGVRLVVAPDAQIGNLRTDTIRGGPLLAGAGFGFRVGIVGALAGALDLRALLAFPDAVAALDAVLALTYDL